MEYLNIIALKFAITVAYILLPGFAVSMIFFQRGKIDFAERIAFSIALTIATVPLILFYLVMFGITISRSITIISLIIIITVSLVLSALRGNFRKYDGSIENGY
jgi:uncharacterized membrane protein